MLVLVLVISNIALGGFGFYFLRGLDEKYSALLGQTVPALSDLQTLTAMAGEAMHRTNPNLMGPPGEQGQMLERTRQAIEDDRALRGTVLRRRWLPTDANERREFERAGDAFTRAANADSRCVILTGSGKAFCAGMDLDELRGTFDDDADRGWDDAAKLSAAVNGAAVAGGAGLVTVCDLAVSVPDAKFGYPEVRRGLVAAMVMPHLLRHVGERAARWMLLTGELIDASEAMRVGMLNAVVPSETLLPTAMAWAKSIAEGGPKALAKTKDLLRDVPSVGDLAKASAEPRLTDECRGGLTAFFEKRPAPWV